jgi:SAM-dependent methyltransferase
MSEIGRSGAAFVESAYWIALGRPPAPEELTRALRGLHEGSKGTLLIWLLTIPEGIRHRSTCLTRADSADRRDLERGLRALGSDADFVSQAYEGLLGRTADDDGLRHYAGALARGDSRVSVLRSIVASDEFERRVTSLLTFGVVPRDVQLCELANPAKWDNPEWVGILRDLGHTDDKASMHRKAYEFTQLVFGLQRLGLLTTDTRIISIGAGHELILYWLANRARLVIATDLYGNTWRHARGSEGDPRVLVEPELYAPFPYRRDHLRFVIMDGRSVAFRDGAFDVAYCLSSIEHFGGLPGAVAAVAEMARVLRPGGVLALATEYVLSGPPHEETFQPEAFEALLRQPGLELVQPVDVDVYRRYEFTPVDLHRNPYQSPHMVVRFGDTVFTTAMVFLRRIGSGVTASTS